MYHLDLTLSSHKKGEGRNTGKDKGDKNLEMGANYHETVPPQSLLGVIWLGQELPQQVQKEVGSFLKYL